jgi:phosphatidylserine/phosphatidylglycerophosphate/cardiolipin synthase-like enzyme
LVRYHGKYMIIDRRVLFLMAFNLTYADIERSRSFALVMSNPKMVQEAVRLFEADTKRQPYQPAQPGFLVSPVNARKELAAFLTGAKKSLLIYDPKIGDPAMMRVLAARAKAGVDIRVIGRMTRRIPDVPVYKPSQMRLHTRTILRDRKAAFIGSQSLRTLELDARREVGVIFRDVRACAALEKVFEEDWVAASKFGDTSDGKAPAVRLAKKVAKAVTKDLPPVAPVVEGAVKELVGQNAEIEINAEELEQTVKDAVKQAVKAAVRHAVQEVVDEKAAEEEPCLVGGAAGK